MSDTRIENAICQAISILTNKKIGQAPFDRTIRATVLEKGDDGANSYVVMGEGTGRMTVYSNTPDIEYPVDSIVYVLIPGNNDGRDKIIVGGGSTTSTEYKEGIYGYDIDLKGPNLITECPELGLRSYINEEVILYKHGSENNLIEVNDALGQEYINALDQDSQSRYASHIKFSAEFRTQFDVAQRNGEYNIQFTLIFKNDDGVEVPKTWLLGWRQIIGTPFNIPRYTEAILPVNTYEVGEFVRIEQIRAYITDFPNQQEKTQDNLYPKDLFIRNITIQAADLQNEEQISPYKVFIDTSDTGKDLTEDNKYVILTANLKEKAQIINSKKDLQDISYYWFIRDASSTYGTDGYHRDGGKGWRCLNPKAGDFSTLGKSILFTWVDSSNIDIINQYKENKSAFTAINKKTEIKCVVKYKERTIVSENIAVVTNETHFEYQLILDSTDKIAEQNKTVYYLNIGKPSFTVTVKDANGNILKPEEQVQEEGKIIKKTLIFNWQKQDNRGNILPSLTSVDYTQQERNQVVSSYNTLQNQIKNIQQINHIQYNQVLELLTKNKTDAEIAEINRILAQGKLLQETEYYIDNILYNASIPDIHVKTTYSCGVNMKKEERESKEATIVSLGTVSITIYNKIELVQGNNLVLVNGTQVYHYNEDGVSPASVMLQKPLEIKPLTFEWIMPDGTEYSADKLLSGATGGKCRWYLPAKDSFLKFSESVKDSLDETGNYYIIDNVSSITYSIIQNYDNKLKNNTIKLHAELQDNSLDAYTDFTFAKDGDPGTNGTAYVSKLVPKDSSSDRLYLTTYQPSTELGTSILYDDLGNLVDGLEFKFYENSVEIGSSVPEWSILGDKDKDKSNLKIEVSQDNKEKQISLKDGYYFKLDENGYDIIRASHTYNGFVHYAEYPINVLELNSADKQGISYRVKIAPKTGFKYVTYTEDGRTPQYDNTLPFEIIVEHLIGQNDSQYYWERVSKWNNRQIEYECKSYPKRSNPFFTIVQDNNKFTVTPNDTFDGETLNTALVFTLKAKDNGDIFAKLHVPIYMSLNRYGNAAINVWDGNSIDLGSNGTILAPQVGAGSKDDNNAFTGVLMGKVNTHQQDENKNEIYEEGLFGYNKGQRTIFLDAHSGKAEFGKNGAGKIIIDPRNDKAQIYSGNFYNEDGTEKHEGMLIDLTTPEIRFGSGFFAVNKNGYLTAKGGGNIAGWQITDQGFISPTQNLKLGIHDINFKDDNNNTIFNVSLEAKYDKVVDEKGNPVYQVQRDAEGSIIYEQQKDENGNVVKDEDGNPVKVPKLKRGVNDEPIQETKFSGTYLGGTAQIAGWKFDNKQLQSPNGRLTLGNSTVVFKDGKDQEIFKADDTGAVKIGEWIAEYNRLKSSDGKIILDPGGSTFSGNTTIGGWKVNQSSIESNNTTGSKLKLNAGGSLTGGGFSSNGTSGWAIRQDGSATFTNIEANGGTIGGINIANNQISGTGFILGPFGCHFTGLTVTNNGVGYGSVGGYSNGGSSSGGTSGGNSPLARFGGGSPYISPKMKTGPNGETWEQFINIKVDKIDIESLFIYQGKKGYWQSANVVSRISRTGNFLHVYYKQIVCLQTPDIPGTQFGYDVSLSD